MVESLEQRVAELEMLLGLNTLEYTTITSNYGIDELEKRLHDLKMDFILQVPVEKLHRLQQIQKECGNVSIKDKLRSINFSAELMEKRAELLRELQKTSDVVLKSNMFESAQKLMPQLEVTEVDAKEAAVLFTSFDTELNEFHTELLTVLEEIRRQIEQTERRIQLAEGGQEIICAVAI